MKSDYILSIDLGTKNFAYCVIDIKSEKIHKWDCVDLGNVKDTHEKICTNLAKKLDELELTQVPNNTKKKKRMPVGISDFGEMREGNYYFVDNSLFVEEAIESAKVMLIPRPRRFGKTLNLSMLRHFFEISDKDTSQLFDGLKIREQECFEIHQGKYPVIYLTLKDVKSPDWKQCSEHFKFLIYEEYAAHRYLLDGECLFDEEKAYFEKILNKSGEMPDYERSLHYLGIFLHRFHNQPVVMLIDEYDTPLHSGFNCGYYDDVINFMRNFLSGVLKDNPHLFKGVVTGILRVAKESIFSGLNNLGVYSLLDQKFSTSFGFTEQDVKIMLETFEMRDKYQDVSRWYNGYQFGDAVIYNPWSVINYIDNKGKAKAYWTNTADTTMIDRLATFGGTEIREELGELLEGKTIEKPVYETIVMRDLDKRDDLLWSFLLFCGYLKITGDAIIRNIYHLMIPNEEVKIVYEELVIRWFSEKAQTNWLMDMIRALETGSIDLFERLLRLIVKQVMSYHDLGREPEKVYHALVLGMLVWMSGKYDIRSNRESGYGRYDVMLKPKDPTGRGIVIEFKKIDGEAENAHERVLEDALKQIEKRGYAAEFEAAGIRKISKIAVAFRGKELWVAEK